MKTKVTRGVAANIPYKTKIGLIESVLSIYEVVTSQDKRLNVSERRALAYFILEGYNDKTKELVMTESGDKITRRYLSTITYELREKGYLKKSETNYRQSYVDESIQAMMDTILSLPEDSRKIEINLIKIRP